MDLTPTLFVVDDDPAVSRALDSVGQLLGLPVVAFSSARDFLQVYDPAQPGCLILDIKMPGMTGLELQKKLREMECFLPIIMVSGHADVRIAVEVMSWGAVTLLEKPFRLAELIAYIRQALDRDLEQRSQRSQQSAAETQFAQLTFKEREVFELVTSGMMNKQIAAELRLSIRAVEDRRARLMKKLGVHSLAELLQLRIARMSK